jgi:hypothetical protein
MAHYIITVGINDRALYLAKGRQPAAALLWTAIPAKARRFASEAAAAPLLSRAKRLYPTTECSAYAAVTAPDDEAGEWRAFTAVIEAKPENVGTKEPCRFCGIRHPRMATHPYCDTAGQFRLWRQRVRQEWSARVCGDMDINWQEG